MPKAPPEESRESVETEFPGIDQQGITYTLRLYRRFARAAGSAEWVPGAARMATADGRRVELVSQGVYRVMPGSIRVTSTDPAAF